MWDELPMLMQRCVDAGADAIVIRGEAGSFAAGADLMELAQLSTTQQATEHWNSIRNSLNAIAAFPLPTIAMIVGPCMGGGCLLAAACDLRFAEPGAKFSVPVAQLGITLDEANIARLISLVGRGIASEMLFTSKILTAERAQRIGLINEVVPSEDLIAVVQNAADQLKRNSSGAIAQLKQSIARVCERGPQLDEDQTSVAGSYMSEDFRRRVAKVVETFRAP
jgi:enoyl-CoA hydratase